MRPRRILLGVLRERPAAAWIFGALMGALVVTSASIGVLGMFTLLVALVIALLLAFGSRQPAMGGGLVLAIGLWMTYGHFEMIHRCVVDNSTSCTVVDAGGTAYPAIAFVIAGVVLSVYALGKRSVRGGE